VSEANKEISFKNKTVVITGGAGGIGLAVAKSFAALSARVYTLDIHEKLIEDVEAELRQNITHISLDLRDPEAIASAFATINRGSGEIHVLVNNAGIGDVDLIETLSLEKWKSVIDVNLTAPFLCVQAALPMMRKAGAASVINVASIAGKRMSYNGGAAYTSSKSGVLGFTRHAAFELARDGIRVNAICPGPVLTPMIMNSTSSEERARGVENIPLAEWIQPRDIADAILFFASDASRMCTGTTLDVDGGFLVSSGVPYDKYFERRKAKAGQ